METRKLPAMPGVIADGLIATAKECDRQGQAVSFAVKAAKSTDEITLPNVSQASKDNATLKVYTDFLILDGRPLPWIVFLLLLPFVLVSYVFAIPDFIVIVLTSPIWVPVWLVSKLAAGVLLQKIESMLQSNPRSMVALWLLHCVTPNVPVCLRRGDVVEILSFTHGFIFRRHYLALVLDRPTTEKLGCLPRMVPFLVGRRYHLIGFQNQKALSQAASSIEQALGLTVQQAKWVRRKLVTA